MVSGAQIRPFNSGADTALFGVLCRLENEEEPGFILITAAAPGVIREGGIPRATGLAAGRNVSLHLDQVKVPAGNLVFRGEGPYRNMLSWLYAGCGAVALGSLLAAFEIIKEWGDTRVIKGKGNIFKHNPLTASVMAEASHEILLSRLLIQRLAQIFFAAAEGEAEAPEYKVDHSRAAGRDEAAAGPEVIKELLRTPLFKDLLTLSLRDAFSGVPRELAKTLLWEDAPFSLGLLGNLPKMMGFFLALLDELGRQLQNVPPEMLREFASQMMKNLEIPGPAAGEDPQSLEAARDQKIAFTNMVLDKADFGAIRHAVAGRARENRPVNENLIRQIVGDPIRFANVLNTLPPLINNLLNSLTTAVAGLDYPPQQDPSSWCSGQAAAAGKPFSRAALPWWAPTWMKSARPGCPLSL